MKDDTPFGWYSHTQHDQFRAPLDKARCRFRVYVRWHIDVVGHQCPNKAKIEVRPGKGPELCKVHAKMHVGG